MRLTDTLIKSIPILEKGYRRLSDGGGWCLQIRSTGGKSWYFRYAVDERKRNLSLI